MRFSAEEEEFPRALSPLSTHTVGFLSHWFPAEQQCFSLRELESTRRIANEIKTLCETTETTYAVQFQRTMGRSQLKSQFSFTELAFKDSGGRRRCWQVTPWHWSWWDLLWYLEMPDFGKFLFVVSNGPPLFLIFSAGMLIQWRLRAGCRLQTSPLVLWIWGHCRQGASIFILYSLHLKEGGGGQDGRCAPVFEESQSELIWKTPGSCRSHRHCDGKTLGRDSSQEPTVPMEASAPS